MIRPPTVPWDPIEAAAMREINERCSSVVNSLLNCGSRVIGEFKSVVGVIACDIWNNYKNQLLFC